jgi:quercetin dioxygenase-like cupin family protein
MRPRSIALFGTSVLLLFVFAGLAGAAGPASQAVVNYAEILKANPMAAGDTAQAIQVASDETATVNVARFAPGAEVKPHIHKTHSKTLYVIEGSGQMVIDGKETEIKPGSVIHIPMNAVHSAKITGGLTALQVFAPEWKEPDRVPVP